jgi:hypothetical protein
LTAFGTNGSSGGSDEVGATGAKSGGGAGCPYIDGATGGAGAAGVESTGAKAGCDPENGWYASLAADLEDAPLSSSIRSVSCCGLGGSGAKGL